MNDSSLAPAHPEENLSLSKASPDPQSPKSPNTAAAPTARSAAENARIHLIIGPVGAGKSTYALALAREQRAVRLTLDEWMTTLFSPDRPEHGVMDWYIARAARCVDQIWRVTSALLDAGSAVILEIGLLRRSEREHFYRRVADANRELTLHVIDAARDVRRARVVERNRAQGATFSMIVPPAIFELASDLWEPPDAEECSGRNVRVRWTDEDAV